MTFAEFLKKVSKFEDHESIEFHFDRITEVVNFRVYKEDDIFKFDTNLYLELEKDHWILTDGIYGKKMNAAVIDQINRLFLTTRFCLGWYLGNTSKL